MSGISISRWTPLYFGLALFYLLLAQGLMAAGYGYPAHAIEAPQTLAVVHLVTVGWMSLLMCGALLQFVPVLVAKPLVFPRLALPALVTLNAGLVLLACGFAARAGTLDLPPESLALGGLLLAIGFALVGLAVGATLFSARPLPLPALFVAAGLGALAGTVMLGVVFAAVGAGLITWRPLVELTLAGVPYHAFLGLAGWMSFTAFGVSYRLLSMFTLAPETMRATSWALWGVGVALFSAALLGALTLMRDGWRPEGLITLLLLVSVLAVLLYADDIRRIVATRRRKALELNTLASLVSVAMLVLAGLLLLVLVVMGRIDDHRGALVFFVAFGWLTGLGLAQLYKIVPFLTWLSRFGATLGRAPAPRVQDMVNEKRARPWFALYFAATLLATLALLTGWSDAARFCVMLMGLATLAIAGELARARWLFDLPRGMELAFPAAGIPTTGKKER